MNTLIHLVSGQTLQNLLPILALKPSRVIQICSDDRAIKKNAVGIETAARLAGSAAEFVPHELDAPFPKQEAVRQALAKLLQENPRAVVNLTGGTKLMSLGAYLGASAFPGVGILYCDTDNRQFVQVGENPLPRELADFAAIAGTLRVPWILAAQGLNQGRDWKVLKTSSAKIRFGAASIRLLEEHPATMKAIYRTINDHANRKGGKKPDDDDLKRAASEPIGIDSGDEVAAAFMDAAKRAQLVVERKQGWFFNIAAKGPKLERKNTLTKIVQQLIGGAYEGHIHSLLERSPRFSDFLHGVMPTQASEQTAFGETDFLAVEKSRLSLVLISCKSLPPPLEHLESIIARKEQFGGRFAKAILCIKFADAKRAGEIRGQCAKMGIECLIGGEASAAFQIQMNNEQQPLLS